MVFAFPLILVFLLSWFTEPGPLPHNNPPCKCKTSQKLTLEQVQRIEDFHKELIEKARKKYDNFNS